MTQSKEAERATFNVSVLYDAANYTTVVADSPEAAAIAAEEEFGIVSLCCQCTDDIGLGDIVGAHVYKDGQLVLDTTNEGRIAQDLVDANARIAELTREVQAARRAPAAQEKERLGERAMRALSYANGMLEGWNRCVADDESGFERHRSHLSSEALKELKSLAAAPQPPEAAQRKPLTVQQYKELHHALFMELGRKPLTDDMAFCRAIERAHGIK